MANAIIVCLKKKRNNIDDIKEKVNLACENVIPDNLNDIPYIKVNKDVVVGLTYSNSTINLTENGLLLGTILEEYKFKWDRLNTAPDGSFAIFRWDNDYIELLSDVTASRTIWYLSNDEYFIASTSQRMIITFIGSYCPNYETFPWIMSTGALGPLMSWDKRISCVPPNTKIIFNKSLNEVIRKEEKINFKALNLSSIQFEEKLNKKIEDTFNQSSYENGKYYLPLSGGYDSRAILIFLKNKNKINTITWGMKGDQNKYLTDAEIAKELSEYYHTNHTYLEIEDNNDANVNVVIDRFIKNAEGRIDHISGYIDGFKLWSNLKSNGVQGIIRGDVGFSTSMAETEIEVKRNIGLMLLSDYENIPAWIKDMYTDQHIPDYLNRYDNESIATWRDRLYHVYRLPNILAALNSTKTPYIELSNPLLSKKIINEIRGLPDNLRNNKIIFKRIVNKKGPKIKYAKYSSTVEKEGFLKRKEVVKVLINK